MSFSIKFYGCSLFISKTLQKKGEDKMSCYGNSYGDLLSKQSRLTLDERHFPDLNLQF